MQKVITGNHSASWAVKLARVDVIAAYPITPQTSIVEELAEMCADGRMSAEYIHAESEHSALSACIGASAAGVRAFTATSSQGLAYMHEMLHWAAGGRLPMVMAEVNRSLAPPWTIYTDQQDSLSQRDTGWMQFYARDNQTVLDTILMAYRLAEAVNLPAMVVLDAFVLSHTAEAVDIPDQGVVDAFLPKRQAPFFVDPAHPAAYGGMKNVDSWMETRVELQRAMEEAARLIEGLTKEWEELTGRGYAPLELYRMEDAAVAIFCAGTAAWTATIAVDELRRRGIKAGAVGLWMFRPFPVSWLVRTLEKVEMLVVIDRACSYGHSGIFAQECRSALYGGPVQPKIVGCVAGLGGREITADKVVDWVIRAAQGGMSEGINWMDVK